MFILKGKPGSFFRLLRARPVLSGVKKYEFSNEKEDSTKSKEPAIKESIYDLNVAQKFVNGNIKKFDWPTYVIARYYPSAIYDAVFTFHWLYHELSKIVSTTRETSLGVGKLNFWLESIDKIYEDNPVKEPLSICLHQHCKKNHIPKHLLVKLVNSKIYEINTPEVADLAQFEIISENNRTILILLMLNLLRIDFTKHEKLITAAEYAGRSLGMLDYIKRVPHALRKYKLYLPEDILRKNNVSVRTLWNRIDGKPKDELNDVILEVAAHARMHLKKAQEFQNELPPNAFRAFLHCVEAELFFEELEKADFNIFSRGLHSPSYMVLPYRVFTAAKAKKFTLS